MLPMNRIELTAFRFLGGLGSCFIMILSLIWLGLYAAGIACAYYDCGTSESAKNFAYCFHLLYFHNISNALSMNAITPYYFEIIMISGVTISFLNFIISAVMVSAFTKWINAVLVKRIATVWTIFNIIVLIVEFFMGTTFIMDIFSIVRSEESKCFRTSLAIDPDDVSLLSIQNPKPAPHLHQTKLNLQKFRKKIRKLKKDLEFLDVLVDEEQHPEHINNPFILKPQLKNFAEEVWHEMFKTDISDKVQNKSEFLPSDKVMKKFIVKNDIYLDDVDISLLKTFDNLTSIKWVWDTPGENDSVSRRYNDQGNLNNETTNLLEYIKDTNVNSSEIIKADNILDIMAEKYLEQLHADVDILNNTEKFQNITDEFVANSLLALNTHDKEEVLLYLKQFFDGLLPKEQINVETKDTIYRSLADNKLHQRRLNKTSYRKAKSEVKKTDQVLLELCANCSFHILWPGIICMLLSLKTGLVWILNVVILCKMVHYNKKIEVVRKGSRLPNIFLLED